MIQEHRAANRGEAVNRAHGQIDAAGDDNEGRANGHDREEGGVLGELVQIIRAEKFVGLVRLSGAAVPPFERTAKHRKHQPQRKYHPEQAALFETKTARR